MSYVGNNPKFITQTYRPQSSDPSNPVEGMIFRSDGTPRTEGLWEYINGAWQIVGTTALSVSPSYLISNLGIAATVAANALTVAIKTSAGANPTSTDKVTIAFRNATAATGQFSTIDITSALSMVVSSGSTLGQISGVEAYIYVYLINNSGTAEIALSRSLYDDGSIVSTTAEGGAGAADSASTIYSTTARSNVPLRLVGRLLNTQATAGTWASAPSEISLNPFMVYDVSMSYVTNAAQAMSGTTIVVYEDRVYDTHNAYNTSTGVFTAPKPGKYVVCCQLESASRTWATADAVTIGIYKNAVNTYQHTQRLPAYTGRGLSAPITIELTLALNDTVDIRGTIDGNPNLHTSTLTNYLMIHRIP